MRHSKQPFNLLAGLQQRERGECNPRSFMQKTLIYRLKVDYGVTSDPNASVAYLEKLYDRYDQDYQIFRRQVSESGSASGLVSRLLAKGNPVLCLGEKGLGLLTEILNKRDAVRACREVDEIRRTPLHEVACSRNSALINAILKRLGDETVEVCRADRDVRYSPLHWAAQEGNEAAVNAILEQLGGSGAYICRQRDDYGRTPLHCACSSGNAAVIEAILLKLGDTAADACKQLFRRYDGEQYITYPPIYFVVDRGSKEIVKALLDLMEDDFLRRYGWELLCRAAEGGNAAAIELLFSRLGDQAATNYCLQRDGESQHTLLFYAAESGSADAFKLILRQLGDRGAEVCQWNISADALESIVGQLCSNQTGDQDVGADVFALMLDELRDNAAEFTDKRTLLRVACIKGHAAVIEVIIKQLGEVFSNADKQELLSLVVKSGKIEAVNLILEQFGGEAARICQQNGTALLRDAVLSKSGAIVDRMLELFGDRADEICQADITILFEVVKKMDLAVIKTILKRLGDRAIEACLLLNENGCTPLHLTAEFASHYDGVEAILEKLGDMAKGVCQRSDNGGNTPVHCLVMDEADWLGNEKLGLECINAVEAMLGKLKKEEATDICQKPNQYDRTPLYIAVEFGNSALIIILLKQLGDKAVEVCKREDNNGHTPLDVAIKTGCWDVVKPILDVLGDEVKAEEDKLIELARESGNLACLEQLSNYFKELNSENHIHPL